VVSARFAGGREVVAELARACGGFRQCSQARAGRGPAEKRTRTLNKTSSVPKPCKWIQQASLLVAESMTDEE